jgi:ADP-ribosyl-[dinitrogen reductase] hydrolase
MNRVKRAMLGSLVGDAAGAVLEFHHGTITLEEVKDAMKMPGGGRARVGKGQITDDGELTLTLYSALKDHNPSDGIPIHSIVRGYVDWFNSYPFDVGNTCAVAFTYLTRLQELSSKEGIHEELYDDILLEIKRSNSVSEANGCLMRASAIATWFAEHPETPLLHSVHVAKEDSSLSHPSEVCQEVNIIYVLILTLLLRGSTPQETLLFIEDYVKENIKNTSVKEWFYNNSLDISTIDCSKNIGHVKHAFTLAIYFLRNPSITYEEAIEMTLIKGGDTDTNACIVGGLVASYQEIPDYMSKPVLEFDCLTEGKRRPEWVSVKNINN